jgi:hypothetical protein
MLLFLKVSVGIHSEKQEMFTEFQFVHVKYTFKRMIVNFTKWVELKVNFSCVSGPHHEGI